MTVLSASQLRLKVLVALDREGGRVENAQGRCTALLQQIVDFPGETLAFHLGLLARDGHIERDIRGKRCFAIEITASGREWLRSTPADELGLLAVEPTPRMRTAPRTVHDERTAAMAEAATPPLIAGGTRAPVIDFAFEPPPAPPAKPKPLQLHEALADRFELMRADGNEGEWARLARFPSKGGAAGAAKKLAVVEDLDGFEFKAVRDGDGSLLYGVFRGAS